MDCLKVFVFNQVVDNGEEDAVILVAANDQAEAKEWIQENNNERKWLFSHKIQGLYMKVRYPSEVFSAFFQTSYPG